MSGEPHPEERLRREYSFRNFTLDLQSGVLRRNGDEITLRHKSFDVLACLVEHHGRLVTKAALMEAVWPNTAVTDNSLAQCLVEIRRALGDDSQQLIRTVARRGYIFTASVSTPVVEISRTWVGAPAGAPPLAASHPAPAALLWRWIGIALLLVLSFASFFAWRTRRMSENTEPLRAVPLTTLPGVARYPSLSPDGHFVAFTWNGPKQDNHDVYVQEIGSGSPVRLTTDRKNDYNSVWSPDGRSIAFLRRDWEAGRSELRLIPPVGGPERKLAEIRVRDTYFIIPPYLAWCPDSNCLIVADSPGEGKPAALFVVALESGDKRQLTNPQPPAFGDTNPTISPDGRWLVYRRGSLENA